ncbi:putative hydrolase RBBP9/YdeN [Arabidopsis suecica]|uniref:Putative hydrolase RBBP9/YdeN n=1 Tax=Arabidopsis suecica TaxID=45249 RepID=A0A8T1Z932_ARASU|nr:putative hydrolase RBBP9/YdeN [Arabidopsis suecica]
MIASSFSEKCISVINGAPSWAVFFFFDLLDDFLCVVFRFLDEVMEEKLESCHCKNPQEKTDFAGYEFLSETLYRRRNVFRQAGFLRFAKKLPEITKKIGIVTFLRKFLFPQTMKKVSHEVANRWSDCGCKTCVSWTNTDKLNVIVKQPSISAHSMGCIIAIALTAKFSDSVKSVALVAPPYFPDSKEGARDKDVVVPIDCLWNMKGKFPAVEVEVIAGTDHSTVIMSRREVFVASLLLMACSIDDG